MEDKPQSGPYRALGNKLKNLREKAKESLADVSGAVEIDVKQLASYELGRARPTEDVLLLIISHFGVRDDSAIKMWDLAGYGVVSAQMGYIAENDSDDVDQSTAVPKILFTDIVDVIVNNYGVVMNFMQGSGPNAQPVSVAKVGMSREHAKSVLKILEVTLAQTENSAAKKSTKRLTAPDNYSPDENTTN
jgi:transcriptional regulator with XRE-family HTH domain